MQSHFKLGEILVIILFISCVYMVGFPKSMQSQVPVEFINHNLLAF